MVYRDENLLIAQAEWRGSLPIPDAEGKGVQVLLRVPEIGIARQIKLVVELRHRSISDVSITLVAPSLKRAFIYTQHPSDEALHLLRFDSDNHTRLQPLLGESSAGVWQVLVRDSVPKDQGEFSRAAITIEVVVPSPG